MSKVVILAAGGVAALLTVIVMIILGALGGAAASSCTPGGTSGPLPPGPAGQPGAGQIVNYLEKGGESANSAAGVVGNLEQESGLDPTESDGGGGGGIAQWSATWYHVAGPDGSQSLDAFANTQNAAPNTDQAQLAFILYDLRTAYSWLQTKMNAAPNPQTAATMFETGYEDCSGVTGFMQVTPGSLCNDPHRREYAVAALHASQGGGTGTGTTVVVSQPVGSCGPVTGPAPITNGPVGQILASGIAAAPAGAPEPVKRLIAAGNRIIDTFYSQERRTGMLSEVEDSYDCSGATDFALYNAGLGNNAAVNPYGTATAGDSGELMSYGLAGAGKWVDVYGSDGHAFLIVAGLALDTSYQGLPHAPTTVPWHPEPGDTQDGGPDSGPRWFVASQILPSQLADGENWVERHPAGL